MIFRVFLLTFNRLCSILCKLVFDAAVAQSVERRIGSAEVTGPIPVSSFCHRASR